MGDFLPKLPCHTDPYQQEVQDAGVAEERAEYENHACEHPSRYGRHALYVGRGVVDGVEDVDQDEEESDK